MAAESHSYDESPPLASELAQGLRALGLDLAPAQQQQLLRYLALLQKWNHVYNLTSVRDPAQMLVQHLLDSLAALGPLQTHLEQTGARNLLDVGSGGGLPGVVFAIALPELAVTCVDTVGKKVAFIQQVANELQLPQVRAVHQRVEQMQDRFDVVTSRAFATLDDFTRWSRHSVAPGGVWLALKGKRPDAELAALGPQVARWQIQTLQVPRLDAQRCLVWMCPGDPA